MEDIKKMEAVQEMTAEDKKESKEVPVVVTESDTPEGAYVHEFTKPYTYEGKTYTKMNFDFERLTGTDIIAVENEMAAVGEYAISPEISNSFLYRLAAKAAGVGSDVIEHLPIRDFGKIKNKSRNFLISTGF